jgi:methionyl-tRNA formyltransferase
MRAGFLGTPAAAVPALAALLDVADVPVVITRPDAPRGRSGKPAPPPVRLAAGEWGLSVVQPKSSGELLAALEQAELDVGVVVAYGRILTAAMLATTRVGFVNIHFSLLPRWRGAAPVERALLAGDEMGGISFMHLDEGLDTGPIISVVETPIEEDETAGTLTARLSHLGATVLADALPEFMNGALSPAPQLEAGVTHATPLTTAEARLDPHRPAAELDRRVRAFNPRPGAWFVADEVRYKVHRASVMETTDLRIGEVAAIDGRVLLGTTEGALVIDIIQSPGRRPMEALAWMRGRRGESLTVEA